LRTDAFDLKTYLEDQRRLVNKRLQDLIERRLKKERRLCQAMAHSLMAGGKRLRPILCMAAADAVDPSADAVQGPNSIDAPVDAPGDVPVTVFGCAIEMIHTYSLIHDDLPAMDDDDLRRGRPTCHVAYDEATAILAGDALLTLAFEIMAGAALTTPAALPALQHISRACGFDGMIEGQMQDIEAEGKGLDIDGLKQMHEYKTGALIEASVAAGARLSGATGAQRAALSDYARHIGLAFQVTDDILNVEGDPALMGKAAGTDVDRKKSTYPGLMGISASRDFSRELVNNALQALSVFDNKAQPLRAIARYIIDRKR
jgi:geranylgeranyl diphosphate synthase type II